MRTDYSMLFANVHDMSIGPDVGAVDASGGFLVVALGRTFVWTIYTCAWYSPDDGPLESCWYMR